MRSSENFTVKVLSAFEAGSISILAELILLLEARILLANSISAVSFFASAYKSSASEIINFLAICC